MSVAVFNVVIERAKMFAGDVLPRAPCHFTDWRGIHNCFSHFFDKLNFTWPIRSFKNSFLYQFGRCVFVRAFHFHLFCTIPFSMIVLATYFSLHLDLLTFVACRSAQTSYARVGYVDTVYSPLKISFSICLLPILPFPFVVGVLAPDLLGQ